MKEYGTGQRYRLFGTILAVVVGLALTPTTASAANAITEFNAGLQAQALPNQITAGPDGNLWFTEGAGAISRITPSGTITEFSTGLNPESRPSDIVAGPDGNLWFTDNEGGAPGTPAIGRITTSGTITEFSTGLNQEDEPISLQEPRNLIVGPDGNLWFTDSNFSSTGNRAIGRITPSGTITEFELPPDGYPLSDLIVGPDGNLWFSDLGVFGSCCSIGRITPVGEITEFSTPTGAVEVPRRLTVGPDGNVWFTANHGIGRITPSGTITAFSAGLPTNAELGTIVVGPDGNLWFTDSAHIGEPPAVGRITTSGTITEFPLVGDVSHNVLHDLLAGPDGNLWFTDADYETEPGTGAIGRITPAGQLTLFSNGLMPRSAPGALTVGPGGSGLWFTDYTRESGGAVGRVAPVATGMTPQPSLEIRSSGNGSIISMPSGIDCGAICNVNFASGTALTLTATPAPGYVFAGWNADGDGCEFGTCGNRAAREGQQCAGTTPCTFSIRADTRISADFSPEQSESGSGGGQQESGTPASTSAPSSSGSQSKAPSLAQAGVAVAGSVAVAKQGSVLLSLSCTGGGACHGVIKLFVGLRQRNTKRHERSRASRRGQNVLVGKARFTVPAGSHAVVRIGMNHRGMALLHKATARGLKVTLAGTGIRSRVLRLKSESRKTRRHRRA
jgi:streptogramin lyase